MRWTLRKCDALLGTIVAAVAALVFAQLPAFMQQYLQRLGGHVDEAQLNLSHVISGAGFRTLEVPARDTLAGSLEQRVNALAAGQQAIAEAGGAVRPLVFLRELDPDIALATLRTFEPALPLSIAGLAYGLAGIVAGWLVYELIKAPLGVIARRRDRAPAVTERIEPR